MPAHELPSGGESRMGLTSEGTQLGCVKNEITTGDFLVHCASTRGTQDLNMRATFVTLAAQLGSSLG